jgi:hypothetical protein
LSHPTNFRRQLAQIFQNAPAGQNLKLLASPGAFWIADFGLGIRIQNPKSQIQNRPRRRHFLPRNRSDEQRANYRRFGYQVVGQEPVLGITTWFMERLANSAAESP